jgi:hypothetical protein
MSKSTVSTFDLMKMRRWKDGVVCPACSSNSASLFKVRRPPILNFNETLKQVGLTDDWVTFFS